MGCVFSIASSVRECVSEETAYAMLSRAMQQTKIQPKSQKCLWRGKPRWQLSSEGVCRAHWAQVLPIVLISRHLQYTGATQADWNAGGVNGLSCDVICVSFFFCFPCTFCRCTTIQKLNFTETWKDDEMPTYSNENCSVFQKDRHLRSREKQKERTAQPCEKQSTSCEWADWMTTFSTNNLE